MPTLIQNFGRRTPAFRRIIWVVAGVALLLALGTLPGLSQSPLTSALTTKPADATETATNSNASSTTDTESVATAINEKLDKARADLAVVSTLSSSNGTNQPGSLSTKDLALRRGLQERLVRLYEQQLAYLAELDAARNRRTEMTHETQTWTGFAEPRPHSILLLDALRESIQMERLEIENGESALVTLDKLIEENRTSLNQADERIRQMNEQFERNPATSESDERVWPRELERLRSQTASASVATLDLERQIRKERIVGSRIRLGLLQQQLVVARASATFSDADMEQVVSRLDTEQQQLEKELDGAQKRQVTAESGMESARKSLQKLQATEGISSPKVIRASEEFELCRERMETERTTVNLLRVMLQLSVTERTIWEMRFAASHNSTLGTIRQIRARLEQFDRRVKLWEDYYQQQMETSASQVARLEARLTDLDPDSELAPLVKQRLEVLRERDQMYLRVMRNIERGGRLLERLHEGLAESAGNLPFFSRLSDVFSDAQRFGGRLWGFELFVAQDTITVDGQQITGKRSVTLGKVVTAIIILVLGYWLAGWVTGLLEPIFVKRFKIERNQASLVRRWVRVALVFSLTLFSLVSVKIPLTIFAFAGGALAIGLGFGLQTILKNFVSGIIILFERPFRVGDVLDVAGQRGTVASVGIRSSVLQLWDGTDTLIPNSALLENNLTNWTYTNRTVRFTITVGVAYGSDPRRVVQLLTEIAKRHGRVEKNPEPQVFFTNFGASSMDFELRFWVDVVEVNSGQVASDLRQMIVGTFNEHGLSMPFAQQDVNLTATRSIPVHMVPAPEKTPSPEVKPAVPEEMPESSNALAAVPKKKETS